MDLSVIILHYVNIRLFNFSFMQPVTYLLHKQCIRLIYKKGGVDII